MSSLESHLWPTNTAEDHQDTHTNHIEAHFHPTTDATSSHRRNSIYKSDSGQLHKFTAAQEEHGGQGIGSGRPTAYVH